MTINYMMLTKDGVDVYADYPDIARGSVAVATAVTDKVRKSPRVNLIANGSFESTLAPWAASSAYPASVARVSTEHSLGSYSAAVTATADGGGGFFHSQVGDVGSGTFILSVSSKAGSTPRNINFVPNGGSITGLTSDGGANSASGWTRHSWTFSTTGGNLDLVNIRLVPVGAVSGEVHYFDDIRLEEAQDPTITGVPADLAPMQWLFKSKGYSVAPRDIVAPTGFVQSVFRAVRDPAVVTDDSAAALAMQVYNHGWVLSGTLACYLAENPFDGVAVPWPADGGYKVVPVTGTPAVNDGAGTYGFTSVTWPGSGVGVGTLRQLVSGDEGSGRKVAAILDMLAATTNVQRTTIADTFTSTRTSIETARLNLDAVMGAATDSVRAQVDGRSALAGVLGCNAVDAGAANSPLRTAVLWSMRAIVAKEAGLVLDGFPGTRLSVANYETLTQPLDAVLAMPSTY